MKKLFLLITLLLCIIQCNAQSWNFGAEAGYVYNKLHVSDYNSSPRNGFKFGLNALYSFKNNLIVGADLSYIRKGGKIYGNNLLSQNISSIKFAEMDYLQIPIRFGYRLQFNNGFSFTPEVGAYYAVGVHGDSFVTGVDAFNQPYEKRVRTFGNTDGVAYRPCNRNDGGLSFAINAKWNHIGIKFESNLGLATQTYYGNGKQRTFSASIIYWLHK